LSNMIDNVVADEGKRRKLGKVKTKKKDCSFSGKSIRIQNCKWEKIFVWDVKGAQGSGLTGTESSKKSIKQEPREEVCRGTRKNQRKK